jgi:predicted MFS family arabinose efflux permease
VSSEQGGSWQGPHGDDRVTREAQPGRPPRLGLALPLLLLGMAGIYFLYRGMGDLMHARSHEAGIVFLALGVVCLGGGIAIGRWDRRRRSRSARRDVEE